MEMEEEKKALSENTLRCQNQKIRPATTMTADKVKRGGSIGDGDSSRDQTWNIKVLS